MPERASLIGLVSDEYAAIIGHICVTWNQLEEVLRQLTSRYFEYDIELANAIVGLMSDQARVDLLSYLIGRSEKDEAFKSGIAHFVNAYNICKENRNIVVHSSVKRDDLNDPKYLIKWQKGTVNRKARYRYSLDEIKSVLRDMEATLSFILIMFTSDMVNELRTYPKHAPKNTDWKPLPLPEKPRLPRKLTPLPPPDWLDEMPRPLS